MNVDPKTTTISSQLAGGKIARQILDLTDVKGLLVTANCKGENHYDPRRKIISLSLPVFYKPTVYAGAIAAHECGHALQDARGYLPFKIRMVLFPFARFLALVLPFWFFLTLILRPSSFILPAAAYLALAAFHLLTIPIEIDASRRGHAILLNSGMIGFNSDESDAIKQVLRSCVRSYAAAFIMAPLHLIALIFRRSQ